MVQSEKSVEDIPTGGETLRAKPARASGKFDPDTIPTRRGRLGYEESQDLPVRLSLPNWAKDVLCPVCGSVMVLVKGRQGLYGDNLTFQCHARTRKGGHCLTVSQITSGKSSWMMRPGDFEACDYDWEEVIEETLYLEDGAESIRSSIEEDFEVPQKEPQCPWSKMVRSRVIWEEFWRLAREGEGVVSPAELQDSIVARRPQDGSGKNKFILSRELELLDKWMTARTGYLVKRIRGQFAVVGKTAGDLRLEPYSDEDYRKEHGMEI